jgi:hypothetical protein
LTQLLGIMDTDPLIPELAQALRVPAATLRKHLSFPLLPPVPGVFGSWPVHATHARILSICDGFSLFGRESWDGFTFHGSKELREFLDYLSHEKTKSRELGITPILGQMPHIVSMRASDGAIVRSDWEDQDGDGWLSIIAPDVFEYVATVISVREAYGYDKDGMPSDWWSPYAYSGSRFDLGQ